MSDHDEPALAHSEPRAENTSEHPDETASASDTGPADIDQAAQQPYADDESQLPGLPDWGPTDGKHGTDAEREE